MTETLSAIGRLQAEEREKLESPAAVAEREASRHAYADVSPQEAEQLLTSRFAAVLASLNDDPARYLTDAKLDRPLGETAAQVTSEGKTSLMEGPMPVRAEDEEGELEKVNLELEKTNDGWVPVNPLVEVAIAPAVEEGVEVGDEGLAIVQAGAEESTAQPFGDKNLFFSEVEGPGSDTDMLVAPKAGGVEMFDMLRSVASPETLHYQVELPAGADLRPSPSGGAEVVGEDGSLLAEVPAPLAVDAQGSKVPVTLEVEGASLVLHLNHREEEVAYPVLVDPEVLDNWWYSYYNNEKLSTLGNWAYNPGNAGGWLSHGTEEAMWPGHGGLFFAAAPGLIPGGQWAQYAFGVPNSSTYIEKANLVPFARDNRGCSAPSPYPEPYDYAGMLYQEKWNSGNGLPSFNLANQYGFAELGWGQALVFGMGTTNGQWLPCWRDLGMMGAQIWWNDWNYPLLNSVSGAPTGWIKKDNTQRTLNVSASDAGLGVRTVRLIAPGGKESPWNKATCAGTYENRCPNAETGVITYETSQFPFEGETTMGAVAEDPTGKLWSQQFSLKMDGTPPKVTLNGQLARVTEEAGEKEKPQGEGSDKLSLPVYNLKVTAEDGTATETRSGVKEVKLYLDGSATPLKTLQETCSSGTCPRTVTLEYPVALTGLSEGTHNLEIEAVDLVGNSAGRKERKIEFEYIPATGLKEEYVLQHFVIPDGHNYAEDPEYQDPEIAVNVTNGNAVFHERDFEVKTDRASLELERVYNSQLPAEKDAQWGHGWGLAQAPELKPQGGAPKATMMKTGAITNPVNLPESQTQPTFSQKLHAEIGKKAGGGYEVSYKTSPEVSVFASSGQIQETRFEEGEAAAAEGGAAQQQVPVYSSAFGSGGTGNGQFAHPGDVAIDAKGNLWVADENNNRLQEFNQGGEFLKTLGSAGTGNGQFTRPKSIAFDAKGNIWVADSGNSRLEQFSPGGEFLKTVGSAGTGNGQFNGPESIAIDAKGNLWVADTYNHRIQELNEKGEFIKVVNPSGLGAIEPTGVDVGPHGNVWVADWAHNRVVELSEEGSLIRQFGSLGTGNGQFKQPDAVTVDSRGDVWVVDQNNERVQEFNQSGEYVAQFGAAGAGNGQFSFGFPTGMAVDSKGGIWVTDTGNNRVQKWTLPGYAPSYVSSFGSAGAGNGQFAHPGDVALDHEGHLWVVDEMNNRVQEFNTAGEYVGQFGSSGTGNGQFNHPRSIAVSPLGNLWVADGGNCRLEEFSPSGEYLAQTGSCGSGNGQFGVIESIAIDPKGNIWVADTYRNRIQELNEKGEFIRSVGSAGSGAGQLCEPTGIETGPGGNVWTTEWCNNRVSEFNESGEFIRKFGTAGSAGGQFTHPDGIEIDSIGNVWVGDEGNRRVQEFNQSGEYITQFGSAGTGNGQFNFSFPIGIAADSLGHLWVTDSGSSRVQEFSAPDSIGPSAAPAYEPPAVKYSYSGSTLIGMTLEDEASEAEPAMSMSVTSGLTTSVNAGGSGTASLAYSGNKLTSEKDPEGETKYEYDSGNRLTKVTLPNGNWASIVYDTTSRATEVTVHAEGVSKTTHFWYGLEPHETKVWGGGNPEIVYSIGEDGAVYKWAYAEVPPTITSISGSLWGNRNSTTPVENKDQTLYVHASSPHEIASIQVIENGTAVIAETTCEDKSEPPAHNCDEPPPLEWITNAAAHAPGQLNLEVVATDFLGHSTAESFFVTIPQQPPPDPEAPERPDFDSVKQFREDYGLDREHPLTEQQMNTLILELLYEWELGEPAAVAGVDGWGNPMRGPELAEMEYRREYVNQAADVIPEWAEEHAANSYGGFYVDNRAGGVIYVGFTENQHALVESLKQDPRLINPAAIHEFPVPPTTPLSSLEATSESVANALYENVTMAPLTTEVHVSTMERVIEVGATEPGPVREFLAARFGAGAPIHVQQEAHYLNLASRYGTSGPIVAGAGLFNAGICTAGFGSRAQTGELRGQPVYTYFALTAGHCFEIGDVIHREAQKFQSGPEIGTVRRDGAKAGQVHVTDGAAVRIAPELRSHSVLNGDPLEAQSIQGVQRLKVNEEVCWSGIFGGKECGTVRFPTTAEIEGEIKRIFIIEGASIQGDSGGPVWDPKTHKAVGLISIGVPAVEVPCHYTSYNAKWCPGTGVTPLLAAGGSPGIDPTLGVEILKEE